MAIWPPDKKDTRTELLGSVIIVSSCYLVLYLFLSHFRAEVLNVARKTLFILLITLMLTGFIVPRPFEFVFISFISGVVAIFSLTNIYR